MIGDTSARERRLLWIHTTRGSIEACLVVSPHVRTLDFLNLSHRFVSVEASELAAQTMSPSEAGPAADPLMSVDRVG